MLEAAINHGEVLTPERLHTLRDISRVITSVREELLGIKPHPNYLQNGVDSLVWRKVQLARAKAKKESKDWQNTGLPWIPGDIAYSPEYVIKILYALVDTATKTTKGRKEYSRLGITVDIIAKAGEKLLTPE